VESPRPRSDTTFDKGDEVVLDELPAALPRVGGDGCDDAVRRDFVIAPEVGDDGRGQVNDVAYPRARVADVNDIECAGFDQARGSKAERVLCASGWVVERCYANGPGLGSAFSLCERTIPSSTPIAK
jgi:hypothetical protein